MATTRRGTALAQIENNPEAIKIAGKRVSENSLQQNDAKRKRTAFGDISNRGNVNKDVHMKAVKKPAKSKSIALVARPSKSTTKKATKTEQKRVSIPEDEKTEELSYDVIELSQESRKSSQESSSSQSSRDTSLCEVDSLKLHNVQIDDQSPMVISPLPKPEVRDWDDIDGENMKDVHQVALYAHDIFLYYKSREPMFQPADYLSSSSPAHQPELTAHMRAILVDWLVEVQENFELNHETLYMAVKLVDLYLSRAQIGRDRLQLIGATALFIACKFDERCPPVVDDFLYICDDAYKRQELITMEISILKTVGFDLGMPLSYRFLRRYAKCARACMVTLTLARYLLESSLLDYKFTRLVDSRVAASCLLMALRLRKLTTTPLPWSVTMKHYTGYDACELTDILPSLNLILATPVNKHQATIFTKYSHKVFHEVAKTKALTSEELSEFTELCQSC